MEANIRLLRLTNALQFLPRRGTVADFAGIKLDSQGFRVRGIRINVNAKDGRLIASLNLMIPDLFE
jgi:hypothetical protein